MKNKIAGVLALMLILSMMGFASAADTVTLENMNTNQSIGYQGVSNLTNNTDGSSVNGLCVDEHTSIYFGDTVPVTDGTIGVTNASYVKSLIVNNYKKDMTKQQGYDLQGAIWYFTDGKTPENAEQQAMIDNALADTNVYSDVYDYLYLTITTPNGSEKTNNTELINTETTSNSVIVWMAQDITSNAVTEQTGQTIEENTITNFLGETIDTVTETITGEDRICTITTTTVTDFFEEVTTTIVTTFFRTTTTDNITDYYQNTTTITTKNYYKDTIVTTNYYKTEKDYITFAFNSVQKPDKQNLILFTADYWTDIIYWDDAQTTYNYWDSSNTEVTTEDFSEFSQDITTEDFSTVDTWTDTYPFSIITQTIEWNCVPIVTNNTTVDDPETVPMQDTGAPLAALTLGMLSIVGGAIVGRRK